MTRALAPIAALWKREVLKFVRDRSRLFGALGQPLGFWLLLGFGFEGSFQMAGGTADVGYMEFLFPGILALILLFTAVFTTISIVEERKSGALQAVLVAPAPRWALVLGNTLGGTSLALVQALLFVLLLPLLGLALLPVRLLLVALISLLTGLSFTALGFIIAWRMESTRGFHAVMNLLLLPLWMLSGAPFPFEGASPVLQWIMRVNPVSYAVSGLRQSIYWPEPTLALAPLGVCIVVSAAFALALLSAAVVVVRRPLYG